MADVSENAPFTDPATAIAHGRRHLLVRDYAMATTVLAQACELLAQKHGDTADELGEPYLLYGRALLGLAREEAGVLGGGVPGTEEAEEDEDGDEDEEGDAEEKEDEEDEEKETEEQTAATENETVKENKEESTKTEDEGKKQEADEKQEETESKVSESKTEEGTSKVPDEGENAAGPSKTESFTNGPSTSAAQNGDVKQNGEEDIEDTEKEDEEDEVNNLQIAWEVLELAKLVLVKRGPPGWKLLADAYRLLGEVAMEGGNHQGAINDLQGCLDLLQKIEPREPRAIAEIHYQLGLAHSLGNEFDASIEQFNKATELLVSRIKELEETKEPPKTDDSFYTVEGEIRELKELLPEIQEKITDMKDFKREACKLVIEGIKNRVSGSCSNGAGPSSDASSTSPKVPKPASDISHLVRKKRKADEPDVEVASPCKKPTPEKTV